MIGARKADWPERLSPFVRARARTPFRWGRHDCALFAADWILESTGHDPAAWFRGRYEDALTAQAALRDFLAERGVKISGEADLSENGFLFSHYLESVAWEILGRPLDCVLSAQRGDVVGVRDHRDRLALGVCLGASVVAPAPVRGLGFTGLDEAGPAWRV